MLGAIQQNYLAPGICTFLDQVVSGHPASSTVDTCGPLLGGVAAVA